MSASVSLFMVNFYPYPTADTITIGALIHADYLHKYLATWLNCDRRIRPNALEDATGVHPPATSPAELIQPVHAAVFDAARAYAFSLDSVATYQAEYECHIFQEREK